MPRQTPFRDLRAPSAVSGILSGILTGFMQGRQMRQQDQEIARQRELDQLQRDQLMRSNDLRERQFQATEAHRAQGIKEREQGRAEDFLKQTPEERDTVQFGRQKELDAIQHGFDLERDKARAGLQGAPGQPKPKEDISFAQALRENAGREFFLDGAFPQSPELNEAVAVILSDPLDPVTDPDEAAVNVIGQETMRNVLDESSTQFSDELFSYIVDRTGGDIREEADGTIAGSEINAAIERVRAAEPEVFQIRGAFPPEQMFSIAEIIENLTWMGQDSPRATRILMTWMLQQQEIVGRPERQEKAQKIQQRFSENPLTGFSG